jgi:exonuclease SbcD
MSRLQTIYKNALQLRYDNARTRANAVALEASDVENKSPFELFSEFFLEMNKTEMNEKQSEYIKKLIEEIEEEQE